MADFDQNVDINLDVKTKELVSGLSEAVGEIETAKAAINDLDSDLQDTDIDIGATPDKDEIVTGVLEARNMAAVAAMEADGVNIQIGTDTESANMGELKTMKEMSEAVRDTAEAKEHFSESNKTAAQRARDSVKELDRENQSFDNLIDSGMSLTEAKKAVAGANEHVQDMSKESAREIKKEDESLFNLIQKMDIVEGRMDDVGDSSLDTSNALRRMRAQTDNTSESMVAAAKFSDLFEDGLGSLSLNLGAFTIALRNFLTQIPLILTGLGAMGAAALGAASAFVVLGGAMASLVGVGLLTHAQELESQFSQITGLGQSLEVIMRNLADMFLRALEPLTSLENSTSFFVQAAEGAANLTQDVASMVAQITTGSDEMKAFADATGNSVYTIQDAFNDIDGESLDNIISALMETWVLLGEEATAALDNIGNGIANAIERSAQLVDQIEDLGSLFSTFSDTISELAEVGFAIGGGLLPVFTAFSEVTGRAASFISELDSEMVQNAITFGILILSVNKISSVLGNLLGVVPSVTVGFGKIATSAATATTRFGAFSTIVKGASANMATFLAQTKLSGVYALITGILGLSEGFRKIAFNTEEASGELLQLAIAMKSSEKSMDEISTSMTKATGRAVAFSSEIDDLTEELRELAVQGHLSDEALDNIDADIDTSISDKEKFLPDIVGSSKLVNLAKANDSFGRLNRKMSASRSAGGVASTALDGMSESLSSVANQTTATTKVTSIYQAATQALNLSTIKAAILNRNFGKALKLVGTQMSAAALQTFSYIAAQIGLTGSTLTAAGATAILDLAFTSLTLGLNKLIPAIVVLIAVLGAFVVGVMKNMDSVKGGLESTFNAIMTVLHAVVDVLMTVFIATWDALVDIMLPIIDIFEVFGQQIGKFTSSAESGAGVVSSLTKVLDILQTILGGLIRSFGAVAGIVIKVFGSILEIIMSAVGTIIGGIFKLIDVISVKLGDALGGGASDVKSFGDAFMQMLRGINQAFQAFFEGFEDGLNVVIKMMNDLIREFNQKVPGMQIETLEKVQVARDESDDAFLEDDMEKKENNEITYNEDNSTNIDQTIDADPEDQAQLSRVVSDAIAEANSFERRTQGGQ